MRELDAKVARMVMGWCSVRPDDEGVLKGSPPKFSYGWDVPNYTTEPSADYEVLEHVRESWSELLQLSFERYLSNIWERRIQKEGRFHHLLSRYEPGDYSRAALKALGET